MKITSINTISKPILRSSQTITPNSSTPPAKPVQNNKKDNQKKILIAAASVLLILFLARNKIKKWFKPERPINNKPNNPPKPDTKPEKPQSPEPKKPPEVPKTEPENIFVPDEQYIENLKSKISNAKNYFELKAAETESEVIPQGEIKQDIVSQINVRRQQLIQHKKKEHYLSQYEVAQMMEKYYKQKADASETSVNLIKSRLGEDASRHFKKLVETPIEEYSTISCMTILANRCDGKYLDFWKENPEFLKFYTMSHGNLLMNEQLFSFDKNVWNELISNFIKSVDGTMNQEQLTSLLKYSMNSYYDNINGLLRIKDALEKPITPENLDYMKGLIEFRSLFGIVPEKMKGCQKNVLDMIERIGKKLDSSENVEKDVEELKNYINSLDNQLGLTSMINNIKESSSVLENDIQVTRLEFPEFLRGVNSNGGDIYEMIQNSKTNPEAVAQIEKFFDEGGQISVIRPEFLSTSIPPYSLREYSAKFNITLKKGVEYAYTSDLQHCFKGMRDSTEAEILVMPGHKMTITNAKYQRNDFGWGRWIFDCVVEKNTDGNANMFAKTL